MPCAYGSSLGVLSTILLYPCLGIPWIYYSTHFLSALVGIQSVSPKVTQRDVVILTVVLFLALFLFQRFGTSKVSFTFSPIMVMWFGTNIAIGVYNIVKYEPAILKGLSPHYIIKFFMRNGKEGWNLLGAVFMCITGAEAMFADLGHFNKEAIQLAFVYFVYPSMVITYAGEAAYLTKYPDQIGNAFYNSIPKPVYWPMFVISTLASVVSSQSMISASFSIVKQSLALGCFPRVNMIHTSTEHEGQVYSPEINYILMVICIALVVGFKGGVQLANAYGVVVVWVMIITTCLITLVMLVIWDTNFFLICGFFITFLTIEGVFMTSLLNKIPQGGWVPFAISVFFLIMMLSWMYGRSKKNLYEAKRKMSLTELQDMLSNPSLLRPPGICFFYTDLFNGIPPIIRHYIQHTKSVRTIMVLVTVRTLPIQRVRPEERLVVGKLGVDGVYRCLVHFGYREIPNVEGREDDYIASLTAKLREDAETTEEVGKLDSAMAEGVVFVIGRIILRANKNNNGWFARFTINRLYRFFQKNSKSAISDLGVPPGKTLQVGMLYEI
ncbi:Potassium transporter [Sarracenia purpurea var. burkii]